MFENDVEMYGAQTDGNPIVFLDLFENDVEMYGAQTRIAPSLTVLCLRMM